MKKILALGDSITNGYDGEVDLQIDNYPNVLSKLLHLTVDNYGVNNAMITRDIVGDLPQRARETDFSPYQLTIIFYGTNDYGHRSEDLDQVLMALQNHLKAIQAKAPDMKLMGIVPMNRYDYNQNAENIDGVGGYTMKELQDGITSVYQSLKIPVLDWRTIAPDLVTDDNYQTVLADAHLHPNGETYHKMSKIIANFIQKYELI